MGLSYLAFACSIEALKSVYSSRDEALYEKLITSQNRAIRHYLKLDVDHASSGSRVPALHDIFIGAALTRYEPFVYGYALIGCLYELGTYLGESGGGYGRQMEAEGTLAEMGERSSLLPDMDVTWPIAEMRSVADWPVYFGLEASEVVRRAAAMSELMQRISPVFAERATERAARFVSDFARFYAECAALNQDLIVVAH